MLEFASVDTIEHPERGTIKIITGNFSFFDVMDAEVIIDGKKWFSYGVDASVPGVHPATIDEVFGLLVRRVTD